MAQIRIIECWEAEIQAKPAFSWKDKETGVVTEIEATKEGTANVVLAELEGSNVRLNFQLPSGFNKKVKVGDILHVDVKDIERYTSYLRVRNVNRFIPASK